MHFQYQGTRAKHANNIILSFGSVDVYFVAKISLLKIELQILFLLFYANAIGLEVKADDFL